jgi:AmmeMemoRadiSam system protein B
MSDIRPSPIAGTWYSGDPQHLAESLDKQLAAVKLPTFEGRAIGVIAPHAGHRYSGNIAAHAFQTFATLEPETIAILSPLHAPYRGEVFTSGHSAYETPLGEIFINQDLIAEFERELKGELQFNRIKNDQEHSLEIELPFLQRVLSKPFTLLPIMIHTQTPYVSKLVGNALGKILQERNAVIVASSDLSHFHPATTAEVFDRTILDRIESFDPEGVISAEEEGIGFACGRGAIAAALWAAKTLGADRAKVLAYAHSGDITGDMHSVVGYGAAVLLRTTS